MIVIGLTGSIGVGKSTTAAMFAEAGVPTISADDIVHALYAGRAAPLIEAAFPGTVAHGVVDRAALSAAVLGKPDELERLEAIVHPLVREEEAAFLDGARAAGNTLALVDIPLLFETGRESSVDVVVVVTCAADVQRRRVLARPGMTAEKFEAILARQLPDSQKRKRADFIVETDAGMTAARRQVDDILRELRTRTQGKA